MKHEKNNKRSFEHLSGAVTKVTGSSGAFGVAFMLVLGWAITGPFFGFSDTWQLVINTGTTIITFLMVFLIQQAQNKDTLALQLKLDELIAATKGASNRVLNIEDLSEQELQVLKQFYTTLSEISGKQENLGATHSFDEARKNEEEKLQERMED